jgi:hypothetical protein
MILPSKVNLHKLDKTFGLFSGFKSISTREAMALETC